MTARHIALVCVLVTAPIGAAVAQPEARVEAESLSISPYAVGKWTCLLSGAFAIGLGTAWYSTGSSQADEIEDASRDESGIVVGITQRGAVRLEDEASSHKTRGVVAMTAGAALVAAGVVVWWLQPRPIAPVPPAPSEPPVRPYARRILPLIGPDRVGVLWLF